MIMHPTAPCATPEMRGLERTRFFGNQLVGPADLIQDQDYFREKLRRHNRLLHGWGIVCGACVRRGAGGCEVVIEPGYILGPFGDEIVIDRETTIDVCALGAGEETGCCGESHDPWCGEQRTECEPGVLYLAVRYSECQARPVRTLADACGECGGGDCEYSRIRDSFSVRLLRELPHGYTTPMRQPPFGSLVPCVRGRQRACPPCPPDPWVVLADIEVAKDCTVRRVDCFRHRRYVVSFADYFLVCPPRTGLVSGPSAVAAELPTLMTARAVAFTSGTMDLVDVGMAGATTPPRATVTFTRPDGTTATLPAYFAVRPGDTVADLLEREGDRTYYDPASDTTVALRELYAAAGVALDTELHGTAGALAPFEGSTIDVAGVRSARTVLEDALDPSTFERLDREGAAAPDRALELPATSLAGVSARSHIGRRMAEMTIRDMAAMDRDRFIAEITESSPRGQREANERRAAELWDAARRIVEAEGRD